ncbi:MAG: biotin synthase BioB [Rikenellaceae bacterium]|nr:biotin synthase BioB [Rikenellaceae bacterium]
MGYDEAVALAESTPVEDLCALAGRLRTHFQGAQYETCSIMNARSGHCGEDCKWCSQSRHNRAQVDVYPLVNAGEAVELAKKNAAYGVQRFSLVTSGRGMSDRELDKVCGLYEAIRAETNIKLCASMGLLTEAQMRRLKEAGVTRYHCNLESAPSFFAALCTTHTTAQKLETLQAAKNAGLEICSGGIIGMGETRAQRIELAVALRKAGVDSIPLNVLNPIPGTPLENTPALPDDEILLTAAMFRIINPTVHLRLAGGRIRIAHLVRRLLHSGVSAAITGDMLTTTGSDTQGDMDLFKTEGFSI